MIPFHFQLQNLKRNKIPQNCCRQEGKMLPKLSKSKRWLSVRQHFSSARFTHFSRIPHFCRISLFANSPFLPDFSLRRNSGQVLANLERRCGEVERSGLQKPGSSRNILETCGISASVVLFSQEHSATLKRKRNRTAKAGVWYVALV